MTYNASLAPAFTTACLSSLLWTTGCANTRLSEIKAAGEIAVENAPPRRDAAPGPWTTACLEDGLWHWGPHRLIAREKPVFDLKTFSFVGDQFRFFMEGTFSDGEPFITDVLYSHKNLKFIQIVGRFEVQDPNDATLDLLDDLTSGLNATENRGSGLSWRRDENVWRSARLALRIEVSGNLLRSSLGVFDDSETYKPLPFDESESHTENLPTFETLDRLARSLESSKGAAFDVWRAFAPSYAGLVRFDPEIVQTLRGCLRVE